MRLILFAAALGLAGCTTMPSARMDTDAGAPSRTETIAAVAATAAQVADAIGQTPPATVLASPAAAKVVHGLFVTFDHALDLIDVGIAGSMLPRNTPRALAVKRGILLVQGALNTASAAQRAGTATTYTAALRDAEAALVSLQSTLAQ